MDHIGERRCDMNGCITTLDRLRVSSRATFSSAC
jgi:hypothetical protein